MFHATTVIALGLLVPWTTSGAWSVFKNETAVVCIKNAADIVMNTKCTSGLNTDSLVMRSIDLGKIQDRSCFSVVQIGAGKPSEPCCKYTEGDEIFSYYLPARNPGDIPYFSQVPICLNDRRHCFKNTIINETDMPGQTGRKMSYARFTYSCISDRTKLNFTDNIKQLNEPEVALVYEGRSLTTQTFTCVLHSKICYNSIYIGVLYFIPPDVCTLSFLEGGIHQKKINCTDPVVYNSWSTGPVYSSGSNNLQINLTVQSQSNQSIWLEATDSAGNPIVASCGQAAAFVASLPCTTTTTTKTARRTTTETADTFSSALSPNVVATSSDRPSEMATKPPSSPPVNLTCEPTRFVVVVNITNLLRSDPTAHLENVILGSAHCTGHQNGDVLIFSYNYTDCLSQTKVSGDTVEFRNSLMSVAHPNTSIEHVLSGVRWAVQVTCAMPRDETKENHFDIHVNFTDHVTNSVQGDVIDVDFFEDQHFSKQLPMDPDNPGELSAFLGETVYVRVRTVTPLPGDVILVLQSCSAVAGPGVFQDHSVVLIQNRCPVHAGVQFIARRDHETFFSYQVFAFQDKLAIYIKCNVTICNSHDFSLNCNQYCQ